MPMTQLNPEETLQLLDTALREVNIDRRRAALRELLHRNQWADAIEPMKQALLEPDVMVRRRAAELLKYLSNDARTELLARALADPSWTVREVGVLACGEQATGETMQHVLNCALQDRSIHVRSVAVRVLNQHPALVNIEDLKIAATDPRPPIRCRLAVVIGQLAELSSQLESICVQLLNDSHAKVRLRAVVACGGWGKKAEPFLPLLVRRLFDNEKKISPSSHQTLQMLTASFEEGGLKSWLKLILANAAASHQAIEAVLNDGSLSELERHEFQQLCERRIAWLTNRQAKLAPQASSRTDVVSLTNVVTSLLDAAKVAGRDAAKEAAWLLSQLVALRIKK